LHDLFTNGILYLDLGFDLHRLPQEYLPMVPLFGRALLEMGTEKEDYVRLSQRVGSKTGGIQAVPMLSAVLGKKTSAAWLFLRGKAIAGQSSDLFSILHDVLLTARFDQPERFRQMVLEEKAEQEAMLVPAGHQVVNSRIRAQISEADWASEQMGGVNYLFFLRQLVEKIDSDWPGVLLSLERIRQILLNKKYMLCNVTLDIGHWHTVQPHLVHFLEMLPGHEGKTEDYCTWQPSPTPNYEGLAIPAKVNYVGKGANLYDLGYELDGSILVVRNYLRTTWLWEKVRVQGGAYGGMCAFDSRSGIFTYLSYRDPNLLKTLEIYDQTASFLRGLELSQDELVKTIIGAIGEMDTYQLPDAKGYTSLVRTLVGETDAFRQKMREGVLSASKEDFIRFADILEALNQSGKVVVMGSQEDLEAANIELRTGDPGKRGPMPCCFEITRVL
jgi:Zn-dependent M16 (insulinase) family peptidase